MYTMRIEEESNAEERKGNHMKGKTKERNFPRTKVINKLSFEFRSI